MNIRISVVIATHNRCKYLSQALQGLINQSLDKNDYEVIVVDNASTDATKELVKQKFLELSNLVYIYEPTPSANLARNIGWKKAKAKYVAYLDDDAIPANTWLENILKCFDKVKPEPAIIGGKVVPIWERERPHWLSDKLLSALSLIDYSNTPIYLTGRKLPFSVNMIFQKDLLEQFGGFDLNLGRKGKKLISGDETAIALKIRNAGYSIFYHPEILVNHIIPANRLTQGWFIKRLYWQGYSDALVWKIVEKPTLQAWIKKLMYYVYGFLRNPVNLLQINKEFSDSEKFWFQCIVHARIGFIRGLFAKY